MRVDLPYPSFALVMAPSLRLPSYQSKHITRYHPYPRGGPRPLEDVVVVVYQNQHAHTEGPSSSSEPAQPRLRPTRRCDPVDDDVSRFELDPPVVGVEYDEDELHSMEIPTGLSRSKLAEALSDMLGVLRRRCLQLTSGIVGGPKFSMERLK